MCILDDLKRGFEKDDLKELRGVVETFRFNGFRYQKIQQLFFETTGIDRAEFDELMRRIDVG